MNHKKHEHNMHEMHGMKMNKDKMEHGKEHAHDEHHHDEPVDDEEIRDWRKKLFGAWLFSIPIAILMLAERVFGFSLFSMKYTTFLILALGFPVLFIFGWSTIKGGLRGLFSFYFNMDSLIALGTLVAYLTGFFSLFFSIQDYSGVSSMIMAFYITGKYIESKARGRASQEIRKLLELGAKKARVLRSNKETEVDVSEIILGDIIIIKPGEKIPEDSSAEPNAAARKPAVLAAALSRFGCCSPSEAPETVDNLAREGRASLPHGHSARMVVSLRPLTIWTRRRIASSRSATLCAFSKITCANTGTSSVTRSSRTRH